MITKVYSEDEKACLVIYYYHVRLQKILAEREAVKPDVKSTLTSEEFRSATWICISIAVYNMMSGVNIINGYSTQIFDKIGEEGTFTTSQKKKTSGRFCRVYSFYSLTWPWTPDTLGTLLMYCRSNKSCPFLYSSFSQKKTRLLGSSIKCSDFIL